MIDLHPRVPKQNNSSDCGVYLLQYVESFFQVKMETAFPFPQNYLKPQKTLREIAREKKPVMLSLRSVKAIWGREDKT